MSLFRSDTHLAIWIESNCRQCWQLKAGCPILERVSRTDRKPPQWTRNPRSELMGETYKCSERAPRPPRPAATPDDTMPMFDVDPVPDMGDHA